MRSIESAFLPPPRCRWISRWEEAGESGEERGLLTSSPGSIPSVDGKRREDRRVGRRGEGGGIDDSGRERGEDLRISWGELSLLTFVWVFSFYPSPRRGEF